MNLGQYSVSAAQPGLAVERIANLKIPLPPFDEQRSIVAFIESQLATIRDAQGRIEREIELARELWTTLVAEVVTGQVDVSEWNGTDDAADWEMATESFEDDVAIEDEDEEAELVEQEDSVEFLE